MAKSNHPDPDPADPLPPAPAGSDREQSDTEAAAAVPANGVPGSVEVGLRVLAGVLIATGVLCDHIESGGENWKGLADKAVGRTAPEVAESMMRIAGYGTSVLTDYQKVHANFASSKTPVVASALRMLDTLAFDTQLETLVAWCRKIAKQGDSVLTGDLLREMNVAFMRLTNAADRVRDCSNRVLKAIESGGHSPLSRLSPEAKTATDAVRTAARNLLKLDRLEATGTKTQPDPATLLERRFTEVRRLESDFVRVIKIVDETVRPRLTAIHYFSEVLLGETNEFLDTFEAFVKDTRTFIGTCMADAVASGLDLEGAEKMGRELQQVWERVKVTHEQLADRIEYYKTIVARAPFRLRPDGVALKPWVELTVRQRQVVAALVAIRDVESYGEHSAATIVQIVSVFADRASYATVRRALMGLGKCVVVGTHAVPRRGEASRGLDWYFLYEEAYVAYQEDARVHQHGATATRPDSGA